MNIWDIVKKVGPRLLDVVAPGSGVVLEIVNDFLPDDKKLPLNATGDQLGEAMRSLTPAQQAEIIRCEFDVQIVEIQESHSTLRTMLTADATMPHTTRPKIAYQAFLVIATITLIIVSFWAYAVGTANDKMVKTIMDGWPFVLGVIAPFVGWLNSYFGILKIEQKQKLDAANGISTPSLISQFLSSRMKK